MSRQERPNYREIVGWIGMDPEHMVHLLSAEAYSLQRLRRARTLLSGIRGATAPGMASFALGSLGRLEASELSDLDFAFLYDSEFVSQEQAESQRGRSLDVLRKSFDIPEKTFRSAIDLRALIRNVGGRHDSNDTLTYRALLMTEGAWLHNEVMAKTMKHALFSIYASGEKSRGKFLNTLANDLHRYYRTLCVDYRFKVEEQEKTWAIRLLKLRHSRKLWHLANLVMQCHSSHAFVDSEARDRDVLEKLDWPPLCRLALGMKYFSGESLCAPIFQAHERFWGALSSAVVREELAELPYCAREESAIYLSLHENAQRMDAAAAQVIEHLLGHCRDYLLRFCLL